MSTPYPPQPRRLMRDPSNKLIGGVCAGLAKYLNMDVNLVRILTVVISLFTGIPIVLYIIALFVMPEERTEPPQPPYVNGPQAGAYGEGYAAQSYQQPAPGQPAQAPANDVWGSAGAPWEQPQTAAPASAPAGHPSPTPEQQSWQQPSAWQSAPEPAAEPTAYDTAPADAGTSDAGPVSETTEDAPATAAPDQPPAEAPEPEPVPETDAPQPTDGEGSSTWESAAADPDSTADGDEGKQKE
jgi:phage shock protein PspC (stress-responsive transcriptional regulator)